MLNSKNFGVPQNRERVFIVGHLRGKSRPKVFPVRGSNSKTTEQIIGGGQGNRVYSTVRAVLTPNRLNKRQKGRRFKEDGEPSFTQTGQDKHGIYDGAKIRRLTPKECERLQGFPDSFTKYGVNEKGEQVEISDSQRYKCLGNAVTTNIVKEIMKKIK